jgi:hypothetical protein
MHELFDVVATSTSVVIRYPVDPGGCDSLQSGSGPLSGLWIDHALDAGRLSCQLVVDTHAPLARHLELSNLRWDPVTGLQADSWNRVSMSPTYGCRRGFGCRVTWIGSR